MRFTFGGPKTFIKIEKAAEWAIGGDDGPDNLMILEDGKARPADEHDKHELLMHMRDLAPPY